MAQSSSSPWLGAQRRPIARSPTKSPMLLQKSRSAGTILNARVVMSQTLPDLGSPATGARPGSLASTAAAPSEKPSRPSPPSDELCSFWARSVSQGVPAETAQAFQVGDKVTGGVGASGAGLRGDPQLRGLKCRCFADRLELTLRSGPGEGSVRVTADFGRLAHAELDVARKELRVRLRDRSCSAWSALAAAGASRAGGAAPAGDKRFDISLQSAADLALVQRHVWPLLTRALMAAASQPLAGGGRTLGPSLVWSHG